MFRRSREAFAAARAPVAAAAPVAVAAPGAVSAPGAVVAPVVERAPPAAPQPNGRFLYGRNRWGSYAVPPAAAQRLAARQVLRGGVWEAEATEFLRRSAMQGDVVQAGASFGPWLPAVAGALAPGCLFWALEPNPVLCAAAEETAKLNRIAALELHDVGLSDSDSLGYMPDCLTAGTRADMLASLVRLDAVVAPSRPVAVIHLAFTEGIREALSGARRLIASRRPVLLLERPVPPEWIAEQICGGYESAGTVGRFRVYRCP